METKLEELQEKYWALLKETEEVSKLLEEEKSKILKAKTMDLGPKIPYYTEKLERLKKYIEGFMSEKRGRNTKYYFRKVNSYSDDDYDPMHDPLDWTIIEYDLINMNQYLTIIFDVSNDVLQEFVKTWMQKNVFYAENDEYTREILRYTNSKDKEST
jgi:hypothetical protein